MLPVAVVTLHMAWRAYASQDGPKTNPFDGRNEAGAPNDEHKAMVFHIAGHGWDFLRRPSTDAHFPCHPVLLTWVGEGGVQVSCVHAVLFPKPSKKSSDIKS